MKPVLKDKEVQFKPIYEKLLDRKLPEPNNSGEMKTTCPFHNDNSPSFSINNETGAFHCFKPTCNVGGGIVEFVMKLKDKSKKETKKLLEKEFDELDTSDFQGKSKKKTKNQPPPIDKSEVKKWHTILKNSKKILNYLLNERGITQDTIEQFLLGWDGSRITIPIFDQEGKIRNVRKYKPETKNGESKVISYGSGYGSARLYPVGNLVYDEIMLVEGEMDAILANQMGYKAVTVTGGAGTWKSKWGELFKNKIVNIVYDIDEAGQKGAQKIARLLLPHTEVVKVIDLPINEPKNGDITDYFITLGHTKEELDKTIKKAKEYEIKEHSEKPKDDEIYEVHLSKASKSQYYFKKVRMNTIISGKDLAPYIIPKKIKATCTMDAGNKCEFCPMRLNNGEKEYTFDATDAGILELIMCSKSQQKGIIRKRLGIPKGCYSYSIDVKEAQNVEEIMMMPELDFSSEEREYVIRRGFYVGHGLKPNSPYELTGITVPEPWKQYSTHLIHKAKPSQDNISSFSMNKERKEKLEVFQPDDDQTVAEKFDDIAEDLTHNVTHIYGRQDLIKAVDLVYHSVLAFDFQKQRINRGWVEALIIGDTRTGKSETAQQVMKHYKMGELVTGENTTFAGLIGGMQQTQSRWSITWGKVPLNDRRLVVLDEASGLSQEEISYMSGVRSSGVAEITKIQTEKTHARTRLLWVSNSRDGKPLKEYGYGIWAIKKLIGKSEDIARFEFAVACASEDVPMDEINKKIEMHGEVEHQYTFDKCKELILWAWSRKPEDIEFTDEAIDLILEYATKMGRQYSSKIPLVEGANQRIKLARLAVSAACRTFSTDETGEKVIVKPGHVEFVHEFIDEQYKKPKMGYWDYSEQINEAERTAENKKDDVITYLENKNDLGDLFLQYDYVRNSDIEYMADMEKTEVKNVIKFLTKNRMLRKTSRGFKKTPAFGKILKEWKERKRAERKRKGEDDEQ